MTNPLQSVRSPPLVRRGRPRGSRPPSPGRRTPPIVKREKVPFSCSFHAFLEPVNHEGAPKEEFHPASPPRYSLPSAEARTPVADPNRPNPPVRRSPHRSTAASRRLGTQAAGLRRPAGRRSAPLLRAASPRVFPVGRRRRTTRAGGFSARPRPAFPLVAEGRRRLPPTCFARSAPANGHRASPAATSNPKRRDDSHSLPSANRPGSPRPNA